MLIGLCFNKDNTEVEIVERATLLLHGNEDQTLGVHVYGTHRSVSQDEF